MKTMKITGFLLFVLLVVSQATYAQPEQGRQRMTPEQRNEMLAKRLGLDDAQKVKLAEINKKYAEKTSGFRDKMRDATDEERRELFGEMREIREAQNKEIREILTDEQKEKYDEMLKEMQERWQQRRDERRANPRNGAVRPGK